MKEAKRVEGEYMYMEIPTESICIWENPLRVYVYGKFPLRLYVYGSSRLEYIYSPFLPDTYTLSGDSHLHVLSTGISKYIYS